MKNTIFIFLILLIGLKTYSQNLRNPVNTSNNGLEGMSSDWGPRNWSGTVFHYGLDYSLGQGDPAYALTGGSLTFTAATNPANSYITVGNWVYQHVLVGDHSADHWVLNQTVGSDHILLETESENGTARIFVDNAQYVGQYRNTSWGINDITATQTANANDIVFRARVDHLHILYGTPLSNWNNPLQYITYNSSGSNNMSRTLRFKNNNAVEFGSNNPIYGTQVILESDIDYQSDLDLDKTKIEMMPTGGTYSEIEEWIYSRGNYLNFTNRGAGVSSNNYFDVHSPLALAAILSDNQEGIYPVYTNQTNHLGRDIFKKYLNTQTNWDTNSPSYSDGQYTFRLTTEDVRGNSDNNLFLKIIDNFKPYVKSLQVKTTNSNPVYSGTWSWVGSNLEMTSNDYGCDYSDALEVFIEFSEPMSNSPSVKVNNVSCPSSSGSGTDWVFPIPTVALQASNTITVESSCSDLAGNNLFGFQDETSSVSGSSLPKRNNDGSWSNLTVRDDNVHSFSVSGGTTYEIICPDWPASPINSYYDEGNETVIISWEDLGSDVYYRVYRSDYPQMSPKYEITNDWISGNTFPDTNPPTGNVYYAVEAAVLSTNKSATIVDCMPVTSVYISGGSDHYVDVTPDRQVDPFDDNIYDFYLDIVSDDLNLTYEVEIDYDDGNSTEMFYNYFSGDPMNHEFPENNGIEAVTYSVLAEVTVLDGIDEIEKFDVPFETVTIEPGGYVLDFSCSIPSPIIKNKQCTFTAQTNNARNYYYIKWDVRESESGPIISSTGSRPHTDVTTSDSFSKTFPSTGQYFIRVTMSDEEQNMYKDYVIYVQENFISVGITPIFANNTSFPDDCSPELEVGFEMPYGSGTLQIGSFYDNLLGRSIKYYLTKIEVYVNGNKVNTANFSSLYYSTYPLSSTNVPLIGYYTSSFGNELAKITLTKSEIQNCVAGDYDGLISIKYKVFCDRYNGLYDTWRNEVEYNTVERDFFIDVCGDSYSINSTSVLSDYITSGNSPHGYITFSGSGGVISNKTGFNVVGRQSVKLTNGTKITGSTFKAKVIPCDYSSCDHFKSIIIIDRGDVPTINTSWITIYPNPVCDFLNIELFDMDVKSKSNITILDMTGRQIKTIDAIGLIHTIDVSDLTKGNYVISVISDNGFVNQKFIKE